MSVRLSFQNNTSLARVPPVSQRQHRSLLHSRHRGNAIRHASSHQCRGNTTPRFAASSATPERERDCEQSRRRPWEITGRRPAGLGVSVLFGHIKQAATKLERSLRHRYTAREQALPDHVKDWHPLHLLHILLALDVGESDATCGSQESHCPDHHDREPRQCICLPSLLGA